MNGIGVGLTALLAVAFSGNPTDDDATLDNFRQQSATRLSSTPHIQSLPYALDPDCKNGRASVFDECSDQRVIFDAGLSLAKAEGKTLLVVYGAEWCIWVHVFNKYIRGQYGAFTHTFSSQWEQRWDTETLYEKRGDLAPIEANQLAEFVSQNFVVVFISLTIQKAVLRCWKERELPNFITTRPRSYLQSIVMVCFSNTSTMKALKLGATLMIGSVATIGTFCKNALGK